MDIAEYTIEYMEFPGRPDSIWERGRDHLTWTQVLERFKKVPETLLGQHTDLAFRFLWRGSTIVLAGYICRQQGIVKYFRRRGPNNLEEISPADFDNL